MTVDLTTIDCSSFTDSATNGTMCALLKESGAGIGLFIQYISSPTGVLLIIFTVVAIIGAIGYAIAAIISQRR